MDPVKTMGTLFLWTSVALVFGQHSVAHGTTVDELRQLLQSPTSVTVIDIRNSTIYAAGHIPGAINIPARALSHKQMPPLGRVVICGDGVDGETEQVAAETVDAMPGIDAEVLRGGMAAWEALNKPSTHRSGVHRGRAREIGYLDLERLARTTPDILLVDLRRPDQEQTHLQRRFPGVECVESARQRRPILKTLLSRHDVKTDRLLVLIDDGDGEAQTVARRLRAAGLRRLVILAGGELAVASKGVSEIRKKASAQ